MTCSFEKSTNDGGSSFVDSRSDDPGADKGDTGRYVLAITQKGHDGLKSSVGWPLLDSCECSSIKMAPSSMPMIMCTALCVRVELAIGRKNESSISKRPFLRPEK